MKIFPCKNSALTYNEGWVERRKILSNMRHRDSNPGFQLYVLTLYPLSHTGFQFRYRIESSQFKFQLLASLFLANPHALCHRPLGKLGQTGINEDKFTIPARRRANHKSLQEEQCNVLTKAGRDTLHVRYGNAALARRLYQERYPQRQCPDRKTFVHLHYRLCEYGKFNSPGLGRGRPRSTTPEVQEEILEAVNMTPSISTRRVALQVNVPHTTVWKLLESLRNRIVACFEDIRNTPGVWDRVPRSMRHRCEVCIQAGGGHFEHLL
ncbi:hypothetical protein ANN_25841 [Periplaneta americana]|uniref:DUF4817 domain-containing protein n=1 Tax=Periplaneta americana TaxID=6978 RepID=A0ABQ8S4A7_PERAM|nr:hypothetical protein ANN_25841 [Periplaneta americana]